MVYILEKLYYDVFEIYEGLWYFNWCEDCCMSF